MRQELSEEGRRFRDKLLSLIPKPEPPKPKPTLAITNELPIETERERAKRQLERLKEAERRETARIVRSAQEEINSNRRLYGSTLRPSSEELKQRATQAAIDNLYELKLEIERAEHEFKEADILGLWRETEPFHDR
jgi:hypothetical protein